MYVTEKYRCENSWTKKWKPLNKSFDTIGDTRAWWQFWNAFDISMRLWLRPRFALSLTLLQSISLSLFLYGWLLTEIDILVLIIATFGWSLPGKVTQATNQSKSQYKTIHNEWRMRNEKRERERERRVMKGN